MMSLGLDFDFWINLEWLRWWTLLSFFDVDTSSFLRLLLEFDRFYLLSIDSLRRCFRLYFLTGFAESRAFFLLFKVSFRELSGFRELLLRFKTYLAFGLDLDFSAVISINLGIYFSLVLVLSFWEEMLWLLFELLISFKALFFKLGFIFSATCWSKTSSWSSLTSEIRLRFVFDFDGCMFRYNLQIQNLIL